MEFPTFVIDLSGLYGLMDKPLLEVWWTVFIYGGWIPFVWVIIKGSMEVWLLSRQNKYAPTIKYILLSVSIQRLNEQSPKAIEHMFIHLAGAYASPNFKEKWLEGKFTPAFSFEYASIDGYTQFIIRTPIGMRDLVEASIFSQHPDVEIVEIPDYTKAEGLPTSFPNAEWDCWGTEFTLAKPSAYPLRTYVEFEHQLSGELKDPLASLLESLSRLKKGEQAWIQFLVYPRDQKWIADSLKIVNKIRGKEVKHKPHMLVGVVDSGASFAHGIFKEAMSGGAEAPKKPEKKDELRMLNLSPGEKKSLENMENKMSKTGFGVKIRFVYVAKRPVFRKTPVRAMVTGALGMFSSLDGNAIKNYGKVAPKTDYFWQRWHTEEKKTNIFRNFSNRSSNGANKVVLNVEELASLWHFPQILTKAPLIKKVESRKVEPPFQLPAAPEELPEPPKG